MPESLPPDARVFAVASGKGGVGKTTTAVNVGAALAESGAETVVVDADLGMANVADLLDLSTAGPTLQDALAGETAVEEATYRTPGGMAVVPGTADLQSYAEVEPARLREVVATLRAEFEYVILDAGAGLSHDAALPLGLADAVVLVTTPRETAARDTAKTRELAGRIDATVAGVVVTRVREEPSELGPDAVAERVGASILTAVPEDGAVREALSAGRPIVTHAPGNLVTGAYRQLAAALTGREVAEPAPEAAGSTAADATSIDELIEREADRSTDVSALTGDSPPESDDPSPDAEDTTPTLDIDGEPSDEPEDGEPSDEPVEDVEPSIDADSDDSDAEASGSASVDESDPDAEVEREDDSDAEVETEDAEAGAGDEAPTTEAIPLGDAGEAANGERGAVGEDDDSAEAPGDDPMADIPRFDEESAEEFTRSSEATDALAADPLAAGPGDEAVATEGSEFADADDGDGTGADDATPGDSDEASDADEGSDGTTVGPHVEIDDDPDASGRTGLLGRLAGLFR